MRIEKTKQTLAQLIPQREPLLLVGPPGGGKTDSIKQVCADLKYNLVISHPVLDDRVDYKGLPAIINDQAHFLPFGNLEKMLPQNCKKPLVWFFDDSGQAPLDVQAAMMQLIHGRELNGQKISPLVTFVSATNRKKDKAGVSGMIRPLLDRFIAVLELEFNLDDWIAWMMKQKYDPMIAGYSRWKPDMIINAEPSGEMEKIPTPRSLAGVGRLLKLGLNDVEILAGAVGRAWAIEFNTFRNIITELPDKEEIFKSPKTAPVPKKNDVLYALMANLAFYTQEKNVNALMTYLARVSVEFSVVCFKDCAARLPNIMKNKRFSKWCDENEEVFL